MARAHMIEQEQLRRLIRQRLAAGTFPRQLPTARASASAEAGRFCHLCGLQAPQLVFEPPDGQIIRLHPECFATWEQERARPIGPGWVSS